MTFQNLYWRVRWWTDPRWRQAVRLRYERDKQAASVAGKRFNATALRRFVAGRL